MENIELKVIEKKINSWKKSDKHPCPECGKKLSIKMDYTCSNCNVKLKLKMTF